MPGLTGPGVGWRPRRRWVARLAAAGGLVAVSALVGACADDLSNPETAPAAASEAAAPGGAASAVPEARDPVRDLVPDEAHASRSGESLRGDPLPRAGAAVPPAAPPVPAVGAAPETAPESAPETGPRAAPREPVTAATPVPPAAGPADSATPGVGQEAVVAVLSAYRTEALAKRAIARLGRAYPDLLRGIGLEVEPVDLGERGIGYLVRTPPLESQASATALCAKLIARGQRCRLLAASPAAPKTPR